MASRSVIVVMILVLVLGKADYSSSSSSVGCLERERVALLQLKSTFDNPNLPNPWADWVSWVDDDDSNCCEWPMIKCHHNTGRVIALYLNHTSSLSDSWMQSWYLNISMFLPFEELKYLSLSTNQIAGFIGNEGFERLNNLEVLDLSENKFNDSVLASLNGLSSLKYLDLSWNSLRGPTDFYNSFGRLSRLTNLEFLDLSFNQLSCSIESFLKLEDFINLKEMHLSANDMRVFLGMVGSSALSNLEVLRLTDNNFNNSVFASIRGLLKLKVLDLSYNNLEGSIDTKEFYALSNLEELDMTYNKIDNFLNPEGMEESSVLSNLEVLELFHNKLNNNIFASIRGLSKLKFLDLSKNNLEGSINTKEVYALSNLEELDMSGNSIDNFVNPEGAKGLPNLRVIRMENDKHLNTSLENFLTGLRNSSSLEMLILDGVFINNNSLQSISASTSLQVLYLINSIGLRDILPSQGLCKLRNLQELYLNDNELEGTLPQCWGNFSSLRMLTLSQNNFTGNVASSPLNILTSLEYIAIDGNQFEIPISFRSFFNHSKLKGLRCDDNILIPEVESNNRAPKFQLEHFSFSNGNKDKHIALPSFLCYQYNLIMFYASNNNLSGTFPNCMLHNNTKLESLYLKGNSLVGPVELPPHPNLNIGVLDFSENKLEGRIPPNISLIYPHLNLLNLSYNNFHGNILSLFRDMDALECLDLSSNYLSGMIPKNFIKNCPLLSTVSLSKNNFYGKISPAMFNVTSLNHLWISGNSFTDDIEGNFSLMSLLTLDISDNHFSGELPRWIGNMTFLYGIVMSRNHFQGTIPIEFCKLNELRILDLSDNNLHGSIPTCFNPPSIEHIHLSKNSLEGPMTLGFYNNTRLETLDLGENNISGSIPTWIGSLSRLSYLLMKDNNLEGRIPTQVCQLSRLKIMDLSQNRLSGSLPLCLGTIPFEANDTSTGPLTDVKSFIRPFAMGFRVEVFWWFNVKSFSPIEATSEEIQFTTKRRSLSYKGNILSFMSGVDLSCNQLTGKIPPEMGNLSNIHALNLSHNNFTGSIPTTFFGLRQVESLDLSNNNLNGRIPSQLIQLNFLSAFSVAYNNLSGKTPDQKAQFANFEESSYEGNPLLCGPPILHDNCSQICSASSMLNSSRLHTDDSSYMEAFYMSFIASYVVVLFVITAVLYINRHWWQTWFDFIEKCMATRHNFIVDKFHKLPNVRN